MDQEQKRLQEMLANFEEVMMMPPELKEEFIREVRAVDRRAMTPEAIKRHEEKLQAIRDEARRLLHSKP